MEEYVKYYYLNCSSFNHFYLVKSKAGQSICPRPFLVGQVKDYSAAPSPILIY
jgi:hypothetical protein